ncbi:1714_t:CDS:1 [Paraglomus occultum]|uniref:1714_t:CDS:1 n=1 Tax=Paraglomus occultum TaxID=144539 RepID=A0A9N9B3N5_9GLOM|nr:1714_t:CDS:1 [Paraglomus occultum]
MTDSIVDQVTDPSKTKLFLSDASANIMKQLELTKYVKDYSTFAGRVGALEDMLRSFFQTQEDYSKYLEIQLTVQRERCVELTDKWNSAENQSSTHKLYLNETRKSLEETKKSLNEARENLNEVNRTNPKKEMIELRGDKKEVIELHQKILQHKATEERYAQQILELNRQLEHHKDTEARAAELQKKYDLLKEEAVKYQDTYGRPTKELSAGPCRSNPLTELEMEKGELEKQLREARVNANSYHNAYQHEKAERAAERGFFQQMAQRVKEAEARASELQRRNNMLEEEATGHQAALGDTTNVSWGDIGKIYSIQLGKDIVNLQNSLEEFIRLKDIDQQAASMLLQKYDCRLEPTKLIVSAALQRYIIEKVLRYIKNYFNKSIEDLNGKSNNDLELYTKADLNYFLEALILNSTLSLESYIKEFAETRKGEDELTRMAGVKICQQVYAVLGNRGFAVNDHTFLVSIVNSVLNDLDKCRQIKDESKMKDIEDLAQSVVLEIIRIFYFRFRTQVPVVEYKFYESGDKFDSATMECAQDDDGEGDKPVVEICSFPLVGVNISDKKKRQIFNKAKVQLRPGPSTSRWGIF